MVWSFGDHIGVILSKSEVERFEATPKLLEHLFHVHPARRSTFFHQALNSFGSIRNRRQILWHNSALEQGSGIFRSPKENRKATTIRFFIPGAGTLSQARSRRRPAISRGSMVGCEAASLYRILENQGHLMVDAGARQKLHSFAIDFAFQ